MPSANKLRSRLVYLLAGLFVVGGGVMLALLFSTWFGPAKPSLKYEPRQPIDTSGFSIVLANQKWDADATLEEVASVWHKAGQQASAAIDTKLANIQAGEGIKVDALLKQAMLLNYESQAVKAYQLLEKLRAQVEAKPALAEPWLYTIIYCQGVTALRRGEDENCILCRGESSCILPISSAAVHMNRAGSELAIKHFTEYLEQFPGDLEVEWLLNLAHMTLGEHPHKVDPKYLVLLDRYDRSEFDIGAFRDVGHLAGVNRFNQAGGAIMEDFDNDGLLDIVVTSFDPTEPMAFYRNKGDGTFEDRTREAGLLGQVGGGLQCVQTDYNNDGHMDIFIPRGAWLNHPVRPSLLRNNGNGTFTDVTKEAGLMTPMNSGCGAWADYNNDGRLDLFVCGEKQPSRLYRNRGDGTFEDVTAKSGLPTECKFCKGCDWIDYDNDGFPDLFLNNFIGPAQLFHNNRDGTFSNVTKAMGIDGPNMGFACWAWDYDNDGWLDIFATSYSRSFKDVILGLQGKPHGKHTCKLYRNLQGKGFKDVTMEAGLDGCYATMGCNFGDFDNDGYLDMYLGTGEPNLAMLVPNRMFKNVGGARFAEISTSSRTGHLQKGHGVACGDWRRSGHIDIFIEMGGAVNGDKYHNILFQNPGQGNHWLTVKLVGTKTNRPAIGVRIKAVTSGDKPSTVHRHVSSGSSFGANPLQQTLGLGKADKVALLEITWPTTGKVQVFRDVAVNQSIEITEFAEEYRRLPWTPIAPLK